MAAPRTYTAPMAIVKAHTPTGIKPVALIENITVSETFTRIPVVGLGQLHASEIPVVGWAGTLTCSFITINFSISQMPGAMVRTVNSGSIEDYTDNVLLQEEGLTIDLYKRIKRDVLTNRHGEEYVVSQELNEVFAQIQGAYLNQEGFTVAEGQITKRNQSFMYMRPILFL